MLPHDLQHAYRVSVAVARRTGQWASVRQTGPTMWQCVTHAVAPSGQVHERLLAAGPVEELVVLVATGVNRDFVRLCDRV